MCVQPDPKGLKAVTVHTVTSNRQNVGSKILHPAHYLPKTQKWRVL